MGACTHDSLEFFTAKTQEDVENVYCDMGHKDSHRAFKSHDDFTRVCKNCYAIVCRDCYTDVDPQP